MKVEWNTGLVAHLGIEFLEVTPDRVVARLLMNEKLATVGGGIHGGTLMAFADTIGAAGTVANLAEGQRTATIESKTNFMRAVRSGAAHATTRPLHVGRQTIVLQTEIRDDAGKLVAFVTQTQAVLLPRS